VLQKVLNKKLEMWSNDICREWKSVHDGQCPKEIQKGNPDFRKLLAEFTHKKV
jgi:hypothetical protein